MPFEGFDARAVPAELEMIEARLGLGTYTDDTQMMIALAESLLRCDVVDPATSHGRFALITNLVEATAPVRPA